LHVLRALYTKFTIEKSAIKMFDSEQQTGREHGLMNALKWVTALGIGWLIIETDDSPSHAWVQWEEVFTHVDEETGDIDEWIESGENEYWGDTLPEWYTNLMTGSGSLDSLFGGACDE
jgi:hypothetical protein